MVERTDGDVGGGRDELLLRQRTLNESQRREGRRRGPVARLFIHKILTAARVPTLAPGLKLGAQLVYKWT